MPKIDGALLDPSDTDTGRMESRPPDQLPTAAISTSLPKGSAIVKSALIRSPVMRLAVLSAMPRTPRSCWRTRSSAWPTHRWGLEARFRAPSARGNPIGADGECAATSSGAKAFPGGRIRPAGRVRRVQVVAKGSRR